VKLKPLPPNVNLLSAYAKNPRRPAFVAEATSADFAEELKKCRGREPVEASFYFPTAYCYQ
jgi:hypothetical protein